MCTVHASLSPACLPADTSSGSFAAWTSMQAADGQTPHDYAAMDGGHALNTFIEQKQAGELPEEEGDFAFDPETGELLEECIGADGETLTVRSSSGIDSLMLPGRQQQEAAAGHDAPPRGLSSRAGSREGECLSVVTLLLACSICRLGCLQHDRVAASQWSLAEAGWPAAEKNFHACLIPQPAEGAPVLLRRAVLTCMGGDIRFSLFRRMEYHLQVAQQLLGQSRSQATPHSSRQP